MPTDRIDTHIRLTKKADKYVKQKAAESGVSQSDVVNIAIVEKMNREKGGTDGKTKRE